MSTKKTIESEAREMLEKQLHEAKMREAGRLLVALHVLKENYESEKESLEKQLKEVDTMTIASTLKQDDGSKSSIYAGGTVFYGSGTVTCSN